MPSNPPNLDRDRASETGADVQAPVELWRLDVKRPGGPFLPESFHAAHQEAFDAGLAAVTGQTAEALEPRPGWDFAVRAAGDAEERR